MKKLWTMLAVGLLCGAVVAQEPETEEVAAQAAPAAKTPPGLPPGAQPLPPGAVPVDIPGKQECGNPCVKKICVPEPSKTKKSTVYYDCQCKDYCLPRCPCPNCFKFWKKKKDCANCECEHGHCPKCEKKPRVRAVLIKKTKTEECDSTKCVVKEVPQECCPEECCDPTPAVCPAGEPEGRVKGLP